MLWSNDKDFNAWLDQEGLGTDDCPLDDETLDLMYQAWTASRRTGPLSHLYDFLEKLTEFERDAWFRRQGWRTGPAPRMPFIVTELPEGIEPPVAEGIGNSGLIFLPEED